MIESHVSKFEYALKEKLPGIELQNISKKLTLHSKLTADALINKSVNDSNDFYQTLPKTALPLRQMMAKSWNNLDDDNMNNVEQINSISIHLLTSVSTLIQFVTFKPLSYCFKETVGFDVNASFASRP